MSTNSWWPFGHKKNEKHERHKKEGGLSTSIEKVYTPVSQLDIGMYVTELDRPWLETPFLFQGFELKTQEEIKTLREICEYVYVDMTKRKKTTRTPVAAAPKQETLHGSLVFGVPPKKLGEFKSEISRAEKTYEDAERLVTDFMKKIEDGGGIDTKQAKSAVAECVNSIFHSPDAMLWLTQLKNKDTFTAQHSLNVCILSIILGRHINLSEPDIHKLGLCGMMHDVGKMLIPSEILNKQDNLTLEEIKILKTHTTLGYELLKSSENMHPSAVMVALTHHERLDGKGYPRGIKQNDISPFSKIVSIANAYDNITSNKDFEKRKTHLDATYLLTNMAGTHFDPTLVIKFIESIGVYPPGCLVEMTNGAIALTVEVHDKIKLRPKIIIVLDEDKNPAPEKVIDLSEMPTDRNGNLYTIKNIIRPEDWNIDVSKYYQKGLIHKSFSTKK